MRALQIALGVEAHKALASRVLRATTVLVVAGIAVLAGALVSATRAGNQQIIDQLGPAAGETGWTLLTSVTAQITAAGAMLAFGVGLSWTFGREFADGTITGLFALPISRPTIALAKLCIHLLWVAAVSVLLAGLLLASGVLLGLGPVDGQVLLHLSRQSVLTMLTGLLAIPAAWVATLGRGLLPGIAAVLVILVLGQVTAIATPAAAWSPVSVPALWSLRPELVGPAQLGVVAIIPVMFTGLTCRAWRRLQLDR